MDRKPGAEKIVRVAPGRKIIAELAVSADGYIARKDGGFDWLDRPQPKGNYGLNAFFRTIDTIIWGRKTYDIAVGMGAANQFGSKIRNYVFTHRPAGPSPGVEFVNEPVAPFVERLRAERGKDIWMMGGAGVIASFLEAGAIDEFSIAVIPILIGEGIPLFEQRRGDIALDLIDTKRYPDGVVRLHYRVAGLAAGSGPVKKRRAVRG